MTSLSSILSRAQKELQNGDFEPPRGINGDLVLQYRKTNGLTQNELAARLDVSVDTIRSWEIGRRKPSKMAIRMLELAERN